jgi:hypothetical protein
MLYLSLLGQTSVSTDNITIPSAITTTTSTANSTAALPIIPIAGVAVVVVIIGIIIVIIIVVLVIVLSKRKKSKLGNVGYMNVELTELPKPLPSNDNDGPSDGPIEDKVDDNRLYAEIGPSVKQPPPPPPAKPSGTPPVIEEFPSTSTVVIGREVTFKVSVKGDPSPTCTWYHNGVMVENDYAHEIDNGGSLYIPSVEETHKGTYRFVAVNSKGKVEQEVVLTVTLDDESNDIVGNPEQLNGMTTGSLHINEFGIHVAKGHANNNTAFKALYNVLESGEKEHPVTIAVTPSNKPLNRFANITVCKFIFYLPTVLTTSFVLHSL